MLEKNYFMVRAMHSSEEDFKVFFNNSVVAVGWSEVDFTKFEIENTEQLVKEVKKCYYLKPDIFPQLVGKKLNEVKRFHNINAGDYIIIPFYNSIRLGVAEEKKIYNEDAYDNDLCNQRKISYQYTGTTLKTVPRDVLSEAFQRRLRVRGSTVSNLYEFKDEIEKLFSKESYSWASDFEEKENKLKKILKDKLIDKIKIGKTNLKTGGLGLEYLIQELFECEGYKAEVLAKTAFDRGDADIYAIKSDKFQETKILIQVKHHSGYTNDWGLHQLDQIKKSDSAYEDHKYVFITSADINEDIKQNAENMGIVTIDGNELSEWIIENLSKLKPETKIKLGISAIPQFTEL
jgi:restriction system protein